MPLICAKQDGAAGTACLEGAVAAAARPQHHASPVTCPPKRVVVAVAGALPQCRRVALSPLAQQTYALRQPRVCLQEGSKRQRIRSDEITTGGDRANIRLQIRHEKRQERIARRREGR